MFPELTALEPLLKEILYNCVEHVKATKAALYLSASPDLSTKTFELVTSYQYNPADRKVVTSNDDIVDQLTMKRDAFYVNGVGASPKFAEMQFRQGTDRLLAAPLLSRGRLVGFIDMRDKAAKKPFADPDIDQARKIADEILKLLSARKLFGLTPVTLVQMSPQTPATSHEATVPRQQFPTTRTDVPLRAGDVFSPAANRAIEAAREVMARRLHKGPGGRRALSDGDLEMIQLLLPAALAIPNVVLAAFTAVGHPNNPQSIVAIGNVLEDALQSLQSHLDSWIERAGQRAPRTKTRPQLIYPFGVQVVPVTAEGMGTILSAPVNPAFIDGLILTLAFDNKPEPHALRVLDMFLRQLEQSVDTAIGATAGRTERLVIAQTILQPDFQTFPELVRHSHEVATLAQRFARALGLPPQLIDTVHIAALVHDVGMRLLDYDRMYHRPHLSSDELRALADHPVVGAALVDPLLGHDISQAVLRHHERFDGRGYPSRLSGESIPVASRIIAVVDAWVAMTSQHSYGPTVRKEEAILRLQAEAGTQFDPQLVKKFVDAIDSLVDREEELAVGDRPAVRLPQ